MSEIPPILIQLDQCIWLSRLHALAAILSLDRGERLARMGEALRRLRPGAYLLGTGPSTLGIFSLTVDEIVLGRAATPLENPADTVVDFAVADTLYFTPCEVSRVHAKLVRAAGGAEYVLHDLNSTCGTFVNGERVPPDGEGRALEHGDLISLGPMQVSTYVYYVAAAEEPPQ